MDLFGCHDTRKACKIRGRNYVACARAAADRKQIRSRRSSVLKPAQTLALLDRKRIPVLFGPVLGLRPKTENAYRAFRSFGPSTQQFGPWLARRAGTRPPTSIPQLASYRKSANAAYHDQGNSYAANVASEQKTPVTSAGRVEAYTTRRAQRRKGKPLTDCLKPAANWLRRNSIGLSRLPRCAPDGTVCKRWDRSRPERRRMRATGWPPERAATSVSSSHGHIHSA